MCGRHAVRCPPRLVSPKAPPALTPPWLRGCVQEVKGVDPPDYGFHQDWTREQALKVIKRQNAGALRCAAFHAQTWPHVYVHVPAADTWVPTIARLRAQPTGQVQPRMGQAQMAPSSTRTGLTKWQSRWTWWVASPSPPSVSLSAVC